MDILYVIGSDSQWSDNEMRYSLRSLAKFGKGIDRVFIVGDMPYFVNRQTVTHIPGGHDIYPKAHKNILHKVLVAVQSGKLGRHFLISSDDHFYIKPVDFNRLPLYYREKAIPSKATTKAQAISPYFRSLLETRDLLLRHGLTTYQTNPHCNTHFDVDIYEENKRLFDEAFKLDHGGEMNCIMGNLLIKAGTKPVAFNDCKLGGGVNAANWKERVKTSNCVSGVPNIADTYLGREFLPKMFPDKCIYER